MTDFNRYSHSPDHWCRGPVYRALGLNPNRPIPPTMSKTEGYFYTLGKSARVEGEPIDAALILEVLPSTSQGVRRRGFSHRVVVHCFCGRKIPFGRMHQHEQACARECEKRAQRLHKANPPQLIDWGI